MTAPHDYGAEDCTAIQRAAEINAARERRLAPLKPPTTLAAYRTYPGHAGKAVKREIVLNGEVFEINNAAALRLARDIIAAEL